MSECGNLVRFCIFLVSSVIWNFSARNGYKGIVGFESALNRCVFLILPHLQNHHLVIFDELVIEMTVNTFFNFFLITPKCSSTIHLQYSFYILLVDDLVQLTQNQAFTGTLSLFNDSK